MPLLILVSFIWAVSFGLIKDRLGGLDPTALGVARIALAAVVFLPFLRPRAIPARLAFRFAGIGAIEFGLMYIFYMAAFRHLAAYEVALFTIFTPLWLALLEAVAMRRLPVRLLFAALLATAGAAIVSWHTPRPSRELLAGFALVQGSNLCFALGQFWYRRAAAALPRTIAASSLFAWLYLGALAVTLAVSMFTTDWGAFRPTSAQWGVLAYLGIVASGLCFFWWNIGATRVNAGTLAAFNNAKIPLGVACSLVLFGESANIPRLFIGGALLLVAIWVAAGRRRRAN